jgi:hypothetical protein
VVLGLPSLQDVPFDALLGMHVPEPLHVSGSSHAVSDELPQAVPLPAGVPAVQAPD